MNVTIILLGLTIVLMGLASCAQTPTTYQLHYDINNLERRKFSNNILLMQTDLAIKERFPGGVIEDIPSWTHITNQIITTALQEYLASTFDIRSTILQTDKNTALVNNHRALLKLINREIRKHTRGWNMWPHKLQRFDYSIGSGLSFLSNNQIDTAIVINGLQIVEVTKYDVNITDINAYPSDQITYGYTRFNISLIELDTGDILWNNIDNLSDINIRQKNGVRSMLAHALESFPVSLFRNE